MLCAVSGPAAAEDGPAAVAGAAARPPALALPAVVVAGVAAVMAGAVVVAGVATVVAGEVVVAGVAAVVAGAVVVAGVVDVASPPALAPCALLCSGAAATSASTSRLVSCCVARMPASVRSSPSRSMSLLHSPPAAM